MHEPPSHDDVRAAAERIRPHVHRTPVVRCRTLEDLAGAELHLKCENLQKTGAFKIRGATNAVLRLDDAEAGRGVTTHSSGNHAAALALAARRRGIAAHIVMPEDAPAPKRAAVAAYGARITLCEATVEAREAALAAVVERTGAIWVPSYDHPHIVAGQGTAALELLEDVSSIEMIVTPLGGGGLISGTVLAAAGVAPGCRVFGVEPAGAADAVLSVEQGRVVRLARPCSIADGLLMPLSDLTLGVIRDGVESILTVSDEQIIEAMRLIWERAKLVVEPSGAVPLAAVLAHREVFAGRRVGLILSGGNVDLGRLPW